MTTALSVELAEAVARPRAVALTPMIPLCHVWPEPSTRPPPTTAAGSSRRSASRSRSSRWSYEAPEMLMTYPRELDVPVDSEPVWPASVLIEEEERSWWRR
jgi:hypothetical protein